jgi:hypothetical protein
LHPIGDIEVFSIGALGTNKGNHLVHTITKVGGLQL